LLATTNRAALLGFDEHQRHLTNRAYRYLKAKGNPQVDPMRIKLSVTKASTLLYQGIHDIEDSQDFRRAFGDVWFELQNRRLQKAPNIGATMEAVAEDLLEDLSGAEIRLEKA
jgi:hypothetical protein